MKVIDYKLYNEDEPQKIYTGIDCVSCGWIATTCGDPFCIEDITDYPECCDLIASLIAGDASACEFYECREATEEDYAYVAEWLEIWGSQR